MKLKRSIRQTVTPVELLDAQMENYTRWRAQSHRVAESYRNWKCAPSRDQANAFTRYLAALDLEELAAGDYRRALELPG
jgi:hypothetical protein